MHKHHIVPKHMGGSNDPSNLVELSIQDHAEEHKWLFIEHGHWQDALAWLTLSGQMSCEEAIKEAQKNANLGDNNPLRRSADARKKHKESLTGRILSSAHRAKVLLTAFSNMNNPGRNPSKETREKMRQSHLGWTNNSLGGIPPSQKNTIWITNGVARKKINNSDVIPIGYRRGMR